MNCRYCKEPVNLTFFDAVNDKLALTETCFTCDFWITKIPLRSHMRTVIFNGNFYSIGDGKGSDRWKGFSGTQWKLTYDRYTNMAKEEHIITADITDSKDRTIVAFVFTDDLWHNGKIPDRFKKYFPDNVVDLVSI